MAFSSPGLREQQAPACSGGDFAPVCWSPVFLLPLFLAAHGFSSSSSLSVQKLQWLMVWTMLGSRHLLGAHSHLRNCKTAPVHSAPALWPWALSPEHFQAAQVVLAEELA